MMCRMSGYPVVLGYPMMTSPMAVPMMVPGTGMMVKNDTVIFINIFSFIIDTVPLSSSSLSGIKILKHWHLRSCHQYILFMLFSSYCGGPAAPSTQSHWSVGQPFAPRQGGQWFASMGCTHTYNGTVFSC
jgi:hypothetical protein